MSMVAPVKPAERLDALDVLRGVAICGILLMNIPGMGAVEAPLGHPQFTPTWATWVVMSLFFEGSMRGLFTLLFGAGVLFMTRATLEKGAPIEAADAYFRRCLGLCALGVIDLFGLIWVGDILYLYGVSGMVLFAFRKASPKALMGVAAALILAITASSVIQALPRIDKLQQAERADMLIAQHKPVSKDQQAALKARDEANKRATPDPAKVAENIKLHHSPYAALVAWSFGLWQKLDWLTFVSAVAECVAFMMIGMALFKSGVLTGQRSAGFYATVAGTSFVLAMALRGTFVWTVLHHYDHRNSFYALYSPLDYQIGRLPLTLFWMSGLLFLWKALPRGVFAAQRALGRMALSNYLGQSATALFLFEGLGLFGRFDWLQLWGVAACVWVMQAILSLIWLSRFEMGPMEWLLRSITYWKVLPLARVQRSAGGAAGGAQTIPAA